MYIILESLSEIDPRVVPEMEYLDQYKHWFSEVVYIAPENEHKVNLSAIAHRVVSEEIARACKFASADHLDKLGIAEGSEIHEELIHASMEPHSYKPKVYYTLTEQDKVHALQFLKEEMHIALEMHYRDTLTEEQRTAHQTTRQQISTEIDQLTSVIDAKRMIHTRFGCATSSVLAQEYSWGPTATSLT